jgi:hypothetical protein
MSITARGRISIARWFIQRMSWFASGIPRFVGYACAARLLARPPRGARGMIVLCTIMVPAPKLVSQKNERNKARLMQQQQHRASSFKTGTYLHGDQLASESEAANDRRPHVFRAPKRRYDAAQEYLLHHCDDVRHSCSVRWQRAVSQRPSRQFRLWQQHRSRVGWHTNRSE